MDFRTATLSGLLRARMLRKIARGAGLPACEFWNSQRPGEKASWKTDGESSDRFGRHAGLVGRPRIAF